MRKPKRNYKHLKRKFYIDPNSDKSGVYICEICGKECKSLSTFASHLLFKHEMLPEDYFLSYFRNLTPEFAFEKCGFCNNDAQACMTIDNVHKTVSLSYKDGYMCYDSKCIDNICLEFFGEHYDTAKRKFEHIGANVKYLAKKHKCSEEDVKKNLKHNQDYVALPEHKTDLNGYIMRYGKKEGQRRYDERCNKISRAQTIEWYVERFGIEEGVKRFQSKREKTMKATEDITHSKNQYELFDALNEVDHAWEDERFAGGFAMVDMKSKKYKTVVEYFGDYWHCNPKSYKDDYFNEMLQMTSQQKHAKDQERLAKILQRSKDIDLIVVVWELSYVKTYGKEATRDMIYHIIEEHEKNSQGKKEIRWI